MRIQDEKILMAIARLSQNQDFEIFMDLVRKQQAEAIAMCIEEDNPARHQGRAQAFIELIKTVDGAREAHRQRSGHVNRMSQSL